MNPKTLTKQNQNLDQSYFLVFPNFEYKEIFLWTKVPDSCVLLSVD